MVRGFIGHPRDILDRSYEGKIAYDRRQVTAGKFFKKNQLNAIKAEFIVMIRNIAEFVGPDIIKFSKLWSSTKGMSRKPVLNNGLINRGGWIKILNAGEANLLKIIHEDLLKHNYSLLSNYHHELFEL